MTGPGIHHKGAVAPEAYQRLGDQMRDAVFALLHQVRHIEFGDGVGDVGPLVQGAPAAVLEFAIAPMPMEATSEDLRASLLTIYTALLDQTLMQREMISHGPGGNA